MRLSRIAARSSARRPRRPAGPAPRSARGPTARPGPPSGRAAASMTSATSSGCAAGRSPPPASVSSSESSRASRSVSCSAAVSSRSTSGSRLLSAAASSRSRRPVSGVRSWCDAFATNSRWPRSVVAMRSVMSLNAVATSRCSVEPSTFARASRSPSVHAPRGAGEAAEGLGERAGEEPGDHQAEQQRHDAHADERDHVVALLGLHGVDALGHPHRADRPAARRDRHGREEEVLVEHVAVALALGGRPRSAVRISGRVP